MERIIRMTAVDAPPAPQRLLMPDARYGRRAVIRNLGGFVVLLVVTPALAGHSVWVLAVLVPVIGLMMYRMTVVMHDCAHETLLPSRRLNRVVGTLLGAAAGLSFRTFARLHRRHHHRVGLADDPQGPHYLGAWSSSRARTLWHLLRPLVGYNLLLLRRLSAELSGATDVAAGHRLAELVLIAGLQFVCAAIVSHGFRFWWLAPVPLISAATFGLFFSQLRGFAEHVAMPGVDPAGVVRSHRPHPIDRILLYDVNFNYHREHHLYPQVPSCHLPAVHAALAGERGSSAALPPTMFATIWRRWAAASATMTDDANLRSVP
jgi:fatty acid desaturase